MIVNSIWVVIATVLYKFLTFFLNILLARLLTPEEFGLFMTMRGVGIIVENIYCASVGSIIIKDIAISLKDGVSESLSKIIVLNAFATLICIMLILSSKELVETFFMGNDNLTLGMKLTGFITILSIYSASLMRVYIGIGKFRELALASLIAGVIALPIMIYIVYIYGFNGAFVSLVIFNIIDIAIKYILIRSELIGCVINIKNAIIKLPKIISSIGWLALAAIFSSVLFWNIRIYLINREGSFESVAAYDIAFQVVTVLLIITGATSSVMMMAFSKIPGNGYLIKAMLIKGLIFNVSICIFYVLCVITFAPEILSVYGQKYADNPKILNYVCIATVFMSVSSVIQRFLVSRDMEKIIFKNIIITLTIIIAATIWISRLFKDTSLALALILMLYYIIVCILDASHLITNRKKLFMRSLE